MAGDGLPLSVTTMSFQDGMTHLHVKVGERNIAGEVHAQQEASYWVPTHTINQALEMLGIKAFEWAPIQLGVGGMVIAAAGDRKGQLCIGRMATKLITIPQEART